MVKRTRTKRGGHVYGQNQQYLSNNQYGPNQQPNNWVDTISNSANEIKSSANNLYNSITGPNGSQYEQNQMAYGQNQMVEKQKPWYQFWGGRRRTKSKKNRRTNKKRSYKCRK
jgi:hypothetical protein